MNEKSFRDLQKEAKDLGLKFVGVSKAELVKSIDDYRAANPTVDVKKDVAEEKVDVPTTNTEEKPEYNMASVVNGKREVRVYTLEEHGKDFESLARSFANKNSLVVVMKMAKPSILCPHCGGKIYQQA